MHKVWITRTRPAADESAAVWRAAGFVPVAEPLLDVQAVQHEPLSADEIVIFTSKNAVDYVNGDGQRAICVGDATADRARKAGFSGVVSVDGTSADVTHWVRANLQWGQALVHVSGKHIRGSIVEDLQEAGYSARRRIVYRSTSRLFWPETPVTLAAFYSPMAARIFAEMADGHPLSGLSAICISQATADALKNAKLKSVHIASRPREDELIMAAKSV